MIMFTAKQCAYHAHVYQDSESGGQEEACCMQLMSELFTGSTILKLVNALSKPS